MQEHMNISLWGFCHGKVEKHCCELIKILNNNCKFEITTPYDI